MHFPAVMSVACAIASLANAQSVFINQIPAYSSLPSCAEKPLSTLVRDMVSGCGDGGKTTSYSCFCTKSSSVFDSRISAAASKGCGTSSGANEALGVWSSYCALGANATMTSVPAYATSTPHTSSHSRNATTSSYHSSAKKNSTSSHPSSSSSAQSGSGSGSLSLTPITLTSAPEPASSVAAPSASSTGGVGKMMGDASVGALVIALVGGVGFL